jgi:regulator of protease activity HflC (stomatin/prohibitin superfamily)
MDSALGWIGAIVEWLGRFFPRWTLVQANERGIKYLPGGRTEVLEPGIIRYWPVTTEMWTHPVCRQVLDLRPQTLMTKDGRHVFVSGIVIYSIGDIHTFLVDNYNAEANLEDVLMTAIRNIIINRDFKDIQAGRAALDNSLTNEAQKAAKAFGVEVEAARLSEFCTTRVLSLVGGGLINIQTGGNSNA